MLITQPNQLDFTSLSQARDLAEWVNPNCSKVSPLFSSQNSVETSARTESRRYKAGFPSAVPLDSAQCRPNAYVPGFGTNRLGREKWTKIIKNQQIS